MTGRRNVISGCQFFCWKGSWGMGDLMGGVPLNLKEGMIYSGESDVERDGKTESARTGKFT